jgi:hypothetical protein
LSILHSTITRHYRLQLLLSALCAQYSRDLRHQGHRDIFSASANLERRLCDPSNLRGLEGDLRPHVCDIDPVSNLRSGEDFVKDTASHERRDVVPPSPSTNPNSRLLFEQKAALQRIYSIHSILEFVWRIRTQPHEHTLFNKLQRIRWPQTRAQ